MPARGPAADGLARLGLLAQLHPAGRGAGLAAWMLDTGGHRQDVGTLIRPNGDPEPRGVELTSGLQP